MKCIAFVFMVLLAVLGNIQAIPDPSTTVHIQNYEGPIYLSTHPPSGCSCPYHNDEQFHYSNNPSTAFDTSSTGVASVATATSTTGLSSSTGVTTTEVKSSAEATAATGTNTRGMTSSTALATTGATSFPVVTITTGATTDDDCCCVNRYQSDCIPINGATQSSSSSGTYYPGTSYSNPGPYYKNTETSYNHGTDYNDCSTGYNSYVGTGFNDQRTRTSYAIPRTNYGLTHNKPAYNNYGKSYNTETNCNSPRIDFNCVGRDRDRLGTNYYFEGSVEGFPSKDTAVLGYGLVKNNYNGCQCGCQNSK